MTEMPKRSSLDKENGLPAGVAVIDSMAGSETVDPG